MLMTHNHRQRPFSMSAYIKNPLHVPVIIEVEKHSNMKWEYDHKTGRLYLDRILRYPYFYPYAYGFVPNTLGKDGDELDVLFISEKHYANINTAPDPVDGIIVGGLVMHDEKGEDDKIFVVPLDELDRFMNKSETDKRIIFDNIVWFFSNYKSQDEDRWSRVYRLMDKDEAILTYRRSIRNKVENTLNTLTV